MHTDEVGHFCFVNESRRLYTCAAPAANPRPQLLKPKRAVTPDFRLPKSRRLTGKAAFDALFASGARVHGQHLTVIARPAEGPTRLGIPCGKRYSKNAVVRNRFRRLVREAFRLRQADIPPGMQIAVLPKCRPAQADLQQFMRELPELTRRASQKLQSPPAGATPRPHPAPRRD